MEEGSCGLDSLRTWNPQVPGADWAGGLKGKEFGLQDLQTGKRKMPFLTIKKSCIKSRFGFKADKFDFRHVY